MNSYTREDLREAASCLKQFVELFLQQDKSRKPMLFAMAADILNQLAEAELMTWLVCDQDGFEIDTCFNPAEVKQALAKSPGATKHGLYQLPIKESND